MDAAGKPGAGILEGNFGMYGRYEECLDIPKAHYCGMRNVVLNSSMVWENTDNKLCGILSEKI